MCGVWESLTILFLSGPDDPAASAVTKELQRRGVAVVCFDSSSFPIGAKLTARSDDGVWRARICGEGIDLALDEVRCVWLCHPASFRFHPGMTSAERDFANREAEMALGGLLRGLDCLWVNHPEKVVAAEYKPLQLTVAAEVGLKVPRSLVTNDPDSVAEFFDECQGRVVYKPLSGGDLVGEDAMPLLVYTSVVERDHLRLTGALSAAPCLFQEHLTKQAELRCTVIGDEVFPVQIESQHAPESTVDWRRGYAHLRYRVYQLPRETREQCLRLTRQLGLVYAALDFVITPENELVFLEINPGGQWLWLESETGLPMTEAMADLLSGAVPAGANRR
jgi:glutathione synthase/RimK-type ligase-like ATP-grasp enzyme